MATSFFYRYPVTGGNNMGANVDIHDSTGANITLGQKVSASSLPVVLASDQSAISVVSGSQAYQDSVRYDYSGGSVTTLAWTQIVASLAGAAKSIVLFDSSGQTLELGVGGAGVESRVLIIQPGGASGVIPLGFAAGARVSVRALSATANAGELDITFLG